MTGGTPEVRSDKSFGFAAATSAFLGPFCFLLYFVAKISVAIFFYSNFLLCKI